MKSKRTSTFNQELKFSLVLLSLIYQVGFSSLSLTRVLFSCASSEPYSIGQFSISYAFILIINSLFLDLLV